MRTETLSYVKEHANHLELDNPLLITQKGKARFVLQNVEDYEYLQESLSLLKLSTCIQNFPPTCIQKFPLFKLI